LGHKLVTECEPMLYISCNNIGQYVEFQYKTITNYLKKSNQTLEFKQITIQTDFNINSLKLSLENSNNLHIKAIQNYKKSTLERFSQSNSKQINSIDNINSG